VLPISGNSNLENWKLYEAISREIRDLEDPERQAEQTVSRLADKLTKLVPECTGKPISHAKARVLAKLVLSAETMSETHLHAATEILKSQDY